MKQMVFRYFLLFIVIIHTGMLMYAQDNPVLEGVADAGVMHYNGRYYIAGVHTNGSFYISDDLVNWEGPEHVFSMNNEWTQGESAEDHQLHACDMHYVNGRFHFYWSVNHWGHQDMVVHIGHAVSDELLGPYEEPVKKTWFDDRIDAHLFIDDDRTPYFYSVKFTDGNTIWGQKMKDPGHLEGEPVSLFASLPNTWERKDNRVIEGPWVINYRDRYYMIYNANHTSDRWGNYAMGVAEAESPLGFNHSGKYPNPVLHSNFNDNPYEYNYYFTGSLELFSNWLYTTDEPGTEWYEKDFVARGWKKGDKGFGSQDIENSTTIRQQTPWKSKNIWIRKTFELDPKPSSNLQLAVIHGGDTRIFINGDKVYEKAGSGLTAVDLEEALINQLGEGENVIAIHSEQGNRMGHVDVELIDPLNHSGDDLLFNPGQPNIVKGPNGFEWWLVYFGIKNGGPRSQFINRITFHDRKLHVDGPTGARTSGHRPDPALPAFRDLFDQPHQLNSRKGWRFRTGKWDVQDQQLQGSNPDGEALALMQNSPSTHYLFQAAVKPGVTASAEVGLMAFYKDDSNHIRVGIDPMAGKWFYQKVRNGKREERRFDLPDDFSPHAYHTLTVYKNAGRLKVLIDDLPAPGNQVIEAGFAGQGVAGLFTRGGAAHFDAVVYTPGWDEYDQSIAGWKNASGDLAQKGTWSVTESGLIQTDAKGSHQLLKGDTTKHYEFGVQIYDKETFTANRKTDGGDRGRAGVYPVYVDNDNYLQVSVDFARGKLILEGRQNGSALEEKEVTLKRTRPVYPDVAYSDLFKKEYHLEHPAVIDRLSVVKSIYGDGFSEYFSLEDAEKVAKELFKVNVFDSLRIAYLRKGQWHPLDYDTRQGTLQSHDVITFPKTTMEALRIESAASWNRVPVYKLFARETSSTSYHLRFRKLEDRIVVYLDGEEVAWLKGSWPASRVGLFTKDRAARFNGIKFFGIYQEEQR